MRGGTWGAVWPCRQALPMVKAITPRRGKDGKDFMRRQLLLGGVIGVMMRRRTGTGTALTTSWDGVVPAGAEVAVGVPTETLRLVPNELDPEVAGEMEIEG